MKYYLKSVIDELKEIAAKYPAVTVNFDHPSLVVIERVKWGNKIAIDLRSSGKIGIEAVRELKEKLDGFEYYFRVTDELGDEWSNHEFKAMVDESYAIVPNGEFSVGTLLYEIIGPIEVLLQPKPQPSTKPPEPAQNEAF